MLGTRLFILGALARGGPMHGHRIRGAAQQDRVELWTDIKPGSLYGALRRMADEGLVEVVRTEQDGNLPARTVYAITDQGRADLVEEMRAVLAEAKLRPDAIYLVLQHVELLDRDELRKAVQTRRDAFQSQLEMWRDVHEEAAPWLVGLEPLAFDHTFLRLEAEITWHDRLLAALPSTEERPT